MTRPLKIAEDGTIWKWSKLTGYMPVWTDDPQAWLAKETLKKQAHIRLREWLDHSMPKLCEAANGVCYLCGESLDGNLNRDHVRPKHLGNPYGYNQMPTHVRCNSKKGGREPYACELLYLSVVNEKLRGA